MFQRAKFGVITVIVIAALVALVPLFFKDVRSHFSSSKFTKSEPAASAPASAGGAAVGAGETLGFTEGTGVARSELTSGERIKLYEAENAFYNAVEDVVTQRYLNNYFSAYAKKKNLADTMAGQNDFFKDRVNVSDVEVKRLLDENKDNPNLQRIPEAERLVQVRQYLEGNARRTALRSFVEEAKQRGEIKVAMAKPVEPRLEVSDAGNPGLGPKDAKITIVEFADFQCPFCARMVPTLKDVVKKYDGKVRWVYRDFPLREIHPEALPSAIAASCAGEQGKYFEMHNKLFENYQGLNNDLYVRLAKELGLDSAKFETCRKDSKIADEVMRDQADGTQLGVNGTPTYFVNGRKMGGGDINEFSRVIEEELAKM